MGPEEVSIGARVRVGESHRIVERWGRVGKVVGRYGGEDYVAVDVTFPEGGERLFWPRDLEEDSSAPPPASPSWWRSLLKGRVSATRSERLRDGT